ncbi:MAG: M60 family metallopeptidase, partial [Prevotellaceae bacterium]|nr:M60 family metallopeptidase [Prevotellaceae bacterium]
EVTNNIQTNYVTTQKGGASRFYYADARKAIIDAQQPHCLTGTQENASSEYFLKLAPFWQLHLYLDEALGMDFYKQLYEYYRNNDAVATISDGSGKLQLEFVRQTCRIARLNLVDFFTQWGFLRAVDRQVWDNQSTYQLTVTQADIDALVAEIEAAGYPVPAKDVTTITDKNVEEFR